MTIEKKRTLNHKKACGKRQKDMRCCCGKLLCKVTSDGIVFRCQRCKREMVIDLTDAIVNLDNGWSEVDFREK